MHVTEERMFGTTFHQQLRNLWESKIAPFVPHGCYTTRTMKPGTNTFVTNVKLILMKVRKAGQLIKQTNNLLIMITFILAFAREIKLSMFRHWEWAQTNGLLEGMKMP